MGRWYPGDAGDGVGFSAYVHLCHCIDTDCCWIITGWRVTGRSFSVYDGGPRNQYCDFGVVGKELGKRALWGYLGGVLGVALVAGMLVNYLVDTFGFVVMPQIGEEHQMLPEWLVAISGIVLALLMAKVVFEKIPRSWLRRSDCCS